jgi:hypothetical protein
MEQDKAKVRAYAPRALPSRARCSLTLSSCGSQTPAKGSGRSPSPLWLTLTDRHRLRFAEHQGRHQRSTRLRPAFAHYTLLDRAHKLLQWQALARRISSSFLPGSTELETRVQIGDIMKPIRVAFATTLHHNSAAGIGIAKTMRNGDLPAFKFAKLIKTCFHVVYII